MFAIVAVPFDAYAALPSPQHRWILTCLARYADRDGKCWPTLRQLAADARISLSTVCRRLIEMAVLGVFQRERKGIGRYVYQLAEAYRPRWPGRQKTEAKPSGSPSQHRVSQAETPEQANPEKQKEGARARLGRSGTVDGGLPDMAPQWRKRIESWARSRGRFRLPSWGPKPDEPGCFAPIAVLQGMQRS